MKKLLPVLMILAGYIANAQNEFRAAAFYTDLRKIYNDGQQSFSLYKGAAIRGRHDVFNVKLLLPLADSAIITQRSGVLYAEYYFEPSKKETAVLDRSLSLRQAIIRSFDSTLYTSTVTGFEQNFSTTTYFYLSKNDVTDTNKAILETKIFKVMNRYFLVLRVRGQGRE